MEPVQWNLSSSTVVVSVDGWTLLDSWTDCVGPSVLEELDFSELMDPHWCFHQNLLLVMLTPLDMHAAILYSDLYFPIFVVGSWTLSTDDRS